MDKAQGISRRRFVEGAGAAAAAAVAASALAGCASGSSSESSSSSSSAPTSVRDEINVAITAQPPTMDPLMTVSNVTAEVANNIWESLYSMDDSFEPRPQLATDVEVSDDGLTYTFTLRQGVKFHNGETMTADDVVASMNRWLELNSRAQALLAGSEFTKKSDDEVVLTVPTASSDVLILLASYQQFGAIMPKDIVESATSDGISDYVGTGSYQFDEWQRDQYIRLVKFEDYTSPDGAASGFSGERTPLTDTLTYRFVTDADTTVAGLQTDEYDIAGSVSASHYEDVKDDSNLTLLTNTGGSLTLFMNTTADSRLNETMRQAVLAAIDCEDIMLGVYGDDNLFELNGGFMNPEMTQWAVDGGLDLYNQNDADKAKQLMEEAGYNGETIRLLTTGDYASMYDSTVILQDQLRAVGIESEVDSFEFATMMSNLADTTTWDIMIASQSYQMTPAQLNIVNPSFAGLSDDEVTQGIADMRAAETDEEAKEDWSRVQQRLYEFGAGCCLGHSISLTVTQATVEGFDNFIVPVSYNAYIPE